MSELKTKETSDSVEKFLDKITDKQMKEDSYAILAIMEKATGNIAKMWGTNMVGFGNHRYVYESGREGEWFITGFSPRKQALTLYFMPDVLDDEHLISRLGKVKTGKSCLYIKRLADVDLKILKSMIDQSVKKVKKS